MLEWNKPEQLEQPGTTRRPFVEAFSVFSAIVDRSILSNRGSLSDTRPIWSSLPDELWRLILTHVPLSERLCCTRVSQRLCRAAAAATEELKLCLCSDLQRSDDSEDFQHWWPQDGDQQRSEGFQRWLQHNGQHLTSLEVSHLADALTQLPCQNLRQLCVEGSDVQLGPSSSQPGILHSCRGLTKLHVRPSDSLAALSAVPDLQHLELDVPYNHPDHHTLRLPGSVLMVLAQLTCLHLSGVVVTAESLQHISALQHLQVLHLAKPEVSIISPSNTPGLAQLTGLHTLHLSGANLDPAVLQDYTQLQHIKLDICALSGANSAAVLLSVLGRQLQLQDLELSRLQCDWPAAASAFTAITASSRLQGLTLVMDGLPAGIWQAVFNRQQQLPQLQSVMVGPGGSHFADLQGPAATDFSQEDISMLVDCCPGLQRLDVDLQPGGVQLSALSQLTALTALSIHKATEVSVKSLSALLRLQELSVHAVQPVSAPAMAFLTALRQLRHLDVASRGADGTFVTFDSKVSSLPESGDVPKSTWLPEGLPEGNNAAHTARLQVEQSHCIHWTESQPFKLQVFCHVFVQLLALVMHWSPPFLHTSSAQQGF